MTAILNLEHILVRINKKLNGTWDKNIFNDEEIEFFKQDEGNKCLQDFVLPSDSELTELINSESNLEKLSKALGIWDELDAESGDIKIGEVARKVFDMPEGTYYLPELNIVRVVNSKKGVQERKKRHQVLGNVELIDHTSIPAGMSLAKKNRKEFNNNTVKEFYNNMLRCFRDNRDLGLNYASHLEDITSQMYSENSKAREVVGDDREYHLLPKTYGYQKLSNGFEGAIDFLNRTALSNKGKDIRSLKEFEENSDVLTEGVLNQFEEAIFEDIRSHLSQEVSTSLVIKKYDLNNYFKTLYNENLKSDPLLGNNFYHIRTKIHQTSKAILFLKNSFQNNLNLFTDQQTEKIKQNIFSVDLNFSVADKDYFGSIYGLSFLNGGFNENVRINGFYQDKFVDMDNPFSSVTSSIMTLISNNLTKIYSDMRSFFDKNIDIKSKYLSAFGFDSTSFSKSEGDQVGEIVQVQANISGEELSKSDEFIYENLQTVVKVILDKLTDKNPLEAKGSASISAIFNDEEILRSFSSNTTESLKNLLVRINERTSLGEIDTERLTGIRNHSRDHRVIDQNDDKYVLNRQVSGQPIKENTEVFKLEQQLVDEEVKVGTVSDAYGVKPSTYHDLLDNVLDDTIKVLEDEREAKLDIRREIFSQGVDTDGSLLNLLREKRSFLLDNPEGTFPEEDALQKILTQVSNIEKRTGMRVQGFDNSQESYYSTRSKKDIKPGGLVRASVGLQKVGFKTTSGEVSLDRQTQAIGEGFGKDKKGTGLIIGVETEVEINNEKFTIIEPRVTLLSREMIDKYKDDPKGLEKLREKMDKGFDGRLDFRGSIDDEIDAITGGIPQQTIGTIKRSDGKISAYIKETSTLVVERKSRQNTTVSQDLQSIPDYRKHEIEIIKSSSDVINLHDIERDELNKNFKVKVLGEIQESKQQKSLPVKNEEFDRPIGALIIEELLKECILNKSIKAGDFKDEELTEGNNLEMDEVSKAIGGMVVNFNENQEIRVLTSLKQLDNQVRYAYRPIVKEASDEQNVKNEFMDRVLNPNSGSATTVNTPSGESVRLERFRKLLNFKIAVDRIKIGLIPPNREVHHNLNEISDVGNPNDLGNIIDVAAPVHRRLHTRVETFRSYKDANQDGLLELSAPIVEEIVQINGEDTVVTKLARDRSDKKDKSIDAINQDGNQPLSQDYRRVTSWSNEGKYNKQSSIEANESYKVLSDSLERYYNSAEEFEGIEFKITPITVKENDDIKGFNLPKVDEKGDILEKSEGIKSEDEVKKSNTIKSLLDDLDKSQTDTLTKKPLNKEGEVYFKKDPNDEKKYVYSNTDLDGSLGKVTYEEEKVKKINLDQRNMSTSINHFNLNAQSKKTIDSSDFSLVQVNLEDGNTAYSVERISLGSNIPVGWKTKGSKVLALTEDGCPDAKFWVNNKTSLSPKR